MSIKTNRLVFFSLLSLIFASIFMANINACMSGGNLPENYTTETPSTQGGGFAVEVNIINPTGIDPIVAGLVEFEIIGTCSTGTTTEVPMSLEAFDPSNTLLLSIDLTDDLTITSGGYNSIHTYNDYIDLSALLGDITFVATFGFADPYNAQDSVLVEIISESNTCDLIIELQEYLNNEVPLEEWKNPNNLKAMNNKLDACLDLCNANQLTELNNKLENDIFPKLTSEKVNGKEFKGAWISNSDIQYDLKLMVNDILNSI
jgi:hypothetical protein